MDKSSTVLEVSKLSSSIEASLARDELELHHSLSRAGASLSSEAFLGTWSVATCSKIRVKTSSGFDSFFL